MPELDPISKCILILAVTLLLGAAVSGVGAFVAEWRRMKRRAKQDRAA